MGIKADPERVADLPANVVEVLKGLGFDKEAGYDSLPSLDRDNDDFTQIVQGGQEHVTHEGLIDMAHQDGLALTYTEPVQVPPIRARKEEGEPVIFRAVVATRRGVFSAYGDAHENDTQVDAIIRMAETRAMGRALRAAVNVGSATAEEMPNADVTVE